MTNLFKSEQKANEYKEKHQLHGRVAMPIEGTGKWGLNFPLETHITVVDSAGMVVNGGDGLEAALKNVSGDVAAPPFYIWANEDCAGRSEIFKEAKAIRLHLINEGSEDVYIVDAFGVEVADEEVLAHEALVDAGYFAGARKPEVKPDFSGVFMVNDPQDAKGFAIVGDDIAALILEARDHLIDPAAEREVVETTKATVENLLQSQVAGITIEGALAADWGAVHGSLLKAREYLQKDGVRHTWLDGAIGVAESRAKVPVPDAYLGRESIEASEDAEGRLAERTMSGNAPDERVTALGNALQGMWKFASGLVEKHGMDGDDSMTDEEHAAWQDAAGEASHLLGSARRAYEAETSVADRPRC